MRKLRQVDFGTVRGKRVLVRVSLNVPVVDGVVEASSLRIQHAAEVIGDLQRAGARVIVVAHRGRPEGTDTSLSLDSIARILVSRLTEGSAEFLGFIPYGQMRSKIDALAPGDAAILENVRFHPGESKNDPTFAKQLAELADIYVNDAFANSHRDHASMTGVARLLPSYAGPHLLAELEGLEPIVEPSASRLIGIVGGAKIRSKLRAIEFLLGRSDKVFVGGALATACFVAQGHNVGQSYYHEEDVDVAKTVLNSDVLQLPHDVIVTGPGGDSRLTTSDRINTDEKIVDIGPKTIRYIRESAILAERLLWNGPMGIVEEVSSRVGTDAVAHIMAEASRGAGYGVVGGGNTIGVLTELGIASFIDHISAGGGAMLEYVGGAGMPALDVLAESAK